MTSWADQWDTGADPSPRAHGGSSSDGGKKQGGGVEKTKAAAATGLKKVKAGTAQGFQWIKDKCHKKTAGGKSSDHNQQGGAGY